MPLTLIISMHIEKGKITSTMEILSVPLANNAIEVLVKMAVMNINQDITYIHNERPKFLHL